MAIKICGDATKSYKNTNLLVVILMRLPQNIGLLDLKNMNLFKKEADRNYVLKVCAITGECISCYIRSLSTTGTQMPNSWGCERVYQRKFWHI